MVQGTLRLGELGDLLVWNEFPPGPPRTKQHSTLCTYMKPNNQAVVGGHGIMIPLLLRQAPLHGFRCQYVDTHFMDQVHVILPNPAETEVLNT